MTASLAAAFAALQSPLLPWDLLLLLLLQVEKLLKSLQQQVESAELKGTLPLRSQQVTALLRCILAALQGPEQRQAAAAKLQQLEEQLKNLPGQQQQTFKTAEASNREAEILRSCVAKAGPSVYDSLDAAIRTAKEVRCQPAAAAAQHSSKPKQQQSSKAANQSSSEAAKQQAEAAAAQQSSKPKQQQQPLKLMNYPHFPRLKCSKQQQQLIRHEFSFFFFLEVQQAATAASMAHEFPVIFFFEVHQAAAAASRLMNFSFSLF